MRNEQLPHARGGARLQYVNLAVPLIERPDDADAFGVGRPHRESRALRRAVARRMSTKFLIDALVAALAEQIGIEIGDLRVVHRTGLMPQTRSAYSRMLRSLEKKPMLRQFMAALRLHWSSSVYKAST